MGLLLTRPGAPQFDHRGVTGPAPARTEQDLFALGPLPPGTVAWAANTVTRGAGRCLPPVVAAAPGEWTRREGWSDRTRSAAPTRHAAPPRQLRDLPATVQQHQIAGGAQLPGSGGGPARRCRASRSTAPDDRGRAAPRGVGQRRHHGPRAGQQQHVGLLTPDPPEQSASSPARRRALRWPRPDLARPRVGRDCRVITWVRSQSEGRAWRVAALHFRYESESATAMIAGRRSSAGCSATVDEPRRRGWPAHEQRMNPAAPTSG